MATVIYNTRFNPTVNGDIHLGHLYMALVNEAEAHDSGGKFILRFEDNQKEWVYRVDYEQRLMYMKSTLEDLDWMNIMVDSVLYQRQMEDDCKKLMIHLNGSCDLGVTDRFMFDNQPEFTFSNMVPYPYAPYLTANKVIYDSMSYINLVIRGWDLSTEFSLYTFFCDKWGLPKPRQVFLPRLMTYDVDGLLVEISKTNGGSKVSRYRKLGYDPDKLKEELAEACLIDPKGNWLLKNIKEQPIWNG